MRSRALPAVFLLLTLTGAAACKEEGGVKVSSLTFNGNQAVTSDQLKTILVTQASSKLPWGQDRYFSREAFEADLKRIGAFYTDRGYPDAAVTSFDVKLSEDQSSVDITLNIETLSLKKASRVDKLEPQPSTRLALSSHDKYYDAIVGRNLFGPRNNEPKISISGSQDVFLGREAELTRLFTERGVPGSFADSCSIGRIQGGSLAVGQRTASADTGAAVGRQAAAAIYRGVSR